MKTSSQYLWEPTRDASLRHLAQFVPKAGADYAHHRNFDDPEHVSRLSPWLRFRCLTEQEVVNEVLSQHSLKEAEKYIQEVCWRTYWKGWLEMHEPVWHRYQSDLLRLYEGGDQASEALAAFNDVTGIECFDHWCNELRSTGYLHNHARLWFASIWIFTLRLPWQLGADLFMQQLLDGDVASNALSWRWVAGLQTKGKHYLATADNIARFTRGRFSPDNQLVTDAAPLVEDLIAERGEIPDGAPGPPAGNVGLMVCDDDLAPLEGVTPTAKTVAVCSRSELSPNGVSERVGEFTASLIQNCAPNGTTAVTGTRDEKVDFLVNWTVTERLDNLAIAFVPVGENRKVIQQLSHRLIDENIGVFQIRHAWDNVFWPHAGKGFFSLKKKIPACLEALDKNLNTTDNP